MSSKNVIDAVIEYGSEESECDVSANAHHRDSRRTDELHDDYNEFIVNVCNIIVSSGFEIVSEDEEDALGPHSVSFAAYGVEGTPMAVLAVRFRIVGHPFLDELDSTERRIVFKAYWFGSEKFANTHDLVIGVEQICAAIMRGDWSSLQLAKEPSI